MSPVMSLCHQRVSPLDDCQALPWVSPLDDCQAPPGNPIHMQHTVLLTLHLVLNLLLSLKDFYSPRSFKMCICHYLPLSGFYKCLLLPFFNMYRCLVSVILLLTFLSWCFRELLWWIMLSCIIIFVPTLAICCLIL